MNCTRARKLTGAMGWEMGYYCPILGACPAFDICLACLLKRPESNIRDKAVERKPAPPPNPSEREWWAELGLKRRTT